LIPLADIFISISSAAYYLAFGDGIEANTNEGSTGMALMSSKGELK